ncbi:MAG: glycerophosphodiester phosphodiesterase [Cyclobacteriaceae bacterium]|nr:glycerophosphodiester phosphodiesterase [Cyclobacteriaceae bacterium]
MTNKKEENEFIKNGVIAHRGAWKLNALPQNSIASLEQAIELGCEGSEFDVWLTADDILVVNHDPDFLGIPIESSTYQELLEKKLPNGENIPTAEAYIRRGMEQHQTRLIFELKPSKVSQERGLKAAKKSVELVRQLGAQKWIDYITFDYEAGKRIIELDPDANVAYLMSDKAPTELKEDGFFGLDYHIRVLKEKPEWITEAQELGLTVNAWTVNKEEDMKWLLDMNVDFITTDEPELLLKIIELNKK